MIKDQIGIRCGIGYDTHRLAEGRKLLLGGVEIPSSKGLLGHSDGDVLTHAIVDALLGAAGLGDIGQYFPDTDQKWKGASSIKLLEYIKVLLYSKGWRIINLDTIVVLDQPKLAPHIAEMRNSLAAVLETDPDAINIKAKTSEGASPSMAAAHAVALLQKPNE